MSDLRQDNGGPVDVPSFSMPERNTRVLLSRRPSGIPQAEDFAIDQAERGEPGPGQILVRNIYLSADPAQRGWAASEANYSDAVAIGDPMRALAVGVVVGSRDTRYAEGDFVYGWFDWQDYAVVDAGKVMSKATLPLPLTAFASVLGMNGMTAYLALMECGRPNAGDTLLVSTAAGAVGSIVGQIGKLSGCTTVGLTGSDAKVDLCRTRFGYDHAFNYKTVDIANEVAAAAPDGVNVFFDNTGGKILDIGIRHMAVGGRIVQCGTASIATWNPAPSGLRNEREVLTRRLSWSGFVIFDHHARFAEAVDKLAGWYRDGKLVTETDISNGIDTAPGAIAGLYAGENTGKRLIYVG